MAVQQSVTNSPAFKNLQWKHAIVRLIAGFPKGTKFTSDKLRTEATRQKIGEPAKSNHWGIVLQVACKRFLIRRTGRWLQTQVKTNHGRFVPEWIRT